MKLKVLMALSCLVFLGACSAKIEADGDAGGSGGNPNQSASIQELVVGDSTSPGGNSISVGRSFNGTMKFTYQAPKSGDIRVSPGMSYAINCDLDTAQPRVYLDSSSGTREIFAPETVSVVAGGSYTLRFEFPANSCDQIEITFNAYWL